MEESETLISEREIPRLLAEYQVFAVNCIQNNQLQQSFEVLSRSSELIQAAVSQDASVSAELIILTEHTLAYYYNCVGDSANEAESLMKTMKLFKNYLKSLPSSFLAKANNRIFKDRIFLKLHFQLLSAYSKLELYEEALCQAKLAVRRSQGIVHNTLKACQDHLQRHKVMNVNTVRNQQYVLLESPHYQLFHNLVIKAMPILLYLDEKTALAPRVTLPPMNDLKFEDLTQINPWNFEVLMHGPEIMEELERDLMIDKVLHHIASHFFLGNLLRRSRNDESRIEAKIMMKRAWNIARAFLPSDSSIFLAVLKTREKKIVSRIRSISRIRTSMKSAKDAKNEYRSASTNKFRTSPSKKFNETYKDVSTLKADASLGPLRRKIIGKFKKIKLK